MTNLSITNQNGPYSLIDGVSPVSVALSRESLELQTIVTDPDRPHTEKLEAFEDIINLEVGDTSLTRARNLEREIGLRQIYLKFEGGNPTGTQKDRIAFAQCLDALRRGYDTITIATCGNYGASIALASKLAGLKCLICIPETYQTRRMSEILSMDAEIMRPSGDYESTVEFSKNLALKNEYYDANPGGENTHLQLTGYAEIAYEIYDVLRDAPRAVGIPVSNGTLLAGVYRGFTNLYKRGKTSRIPWIIAGSSYRKNPIVYSWRNKLPDCQDLEREGIHETPINEPLINWHSFDGNEALNAIRESNGWADDISDIKLSGMSKVLREREGLNVLQASTAGLIALMNRHDKDTLEGDRYVAILTGRK